MPFFVLIRHRYGSVVRAHTKMASAHRGVFEYVAENWEEEGMGPMPKDLGSAVDLYFDRMGDRESWRIFVCPLEGVDDPPDDEVELTPDEVAVALQIIGLARVDEVCHYTGMARGKVIELRNSVYEKLKD